MERKFGEVSVPAGSTVVCEGCGTEIVDVQQDLCIGDYHWTKKLGNWRIPEPQKAQPVETLFCLKCGGKWCRGIFGSLYIRGHGWT